MKHNDDDNNARSLTYDETALHLSQSRLPENHHDN